ncbi:cell division protein ZapE [Roseospirillum parvum]|uniref:Cell division protein ZapE n=1 Tax=Roseospirillum parvum TaxID=83401 RepID=A0A1G8AV02_9PROT|nr:cell division protein ZapE [Roseospirillum parvum]SDH24795.1 cell division protein ZapE [Roseospirillum parvum]
MSDGPLALYRARLAQGALAADPGQALAVEKLQSLHKALAGYRPSSGRAGWLARFGMGRREGEAAPLGLYLYGPVGRGKSMLMDLFFEAATIPGKRRIHFQSFMTDVHARVHAWRASGKPVDPLPRLAREVAEEAWLLCLDELEIRDIADAMIVGRLFEQLIACGVVVVTTANRAPDDLYKDGLQRDRFLPFIKLIKDNLDLLALSGGPDHRLGRLAGARVYLVPADDTADAELSDAFRRLSRGAKVVAEQVEVAGRAVPVPRAAGGVARFSFAELCQRPLGPADYHALAHRYHSLVVDGIPRLGAAQADAARRFVTLIDALYEHRVVLLCSAAAPPQELYAEGDGVFEFARTVSRLMEMQSRDYLASTHLVDEEGP